MEVEPEKTSEKPRHAGTANLIPYVKGQPSANPGGRPKGLAKRIREMTNDFKEQTEVMIKISLGKAPGAKVRDQIEAIKWLADRGVGKAIETQLTGELSDSQASALLQDLSTEEIVALVEKLKSVA